jgi:hypothetical protein
MFLIRGWRGRQRGFWVFRIEEGRGGVDFEYVWEGLVGRLCTVSAQAIKSRGNEGKGKRTYTESYHSRARQPDLPFPT